MSKTIDDFKDFFSKNKNKETFYVQELIEKSVYIVKGTLKANNIEIQINADKNITCHGYANELQQVIVVILNNAKDMFISRNIFKPKIEIDVKKFDENLEIIICDNAGGISPSIVDKIFEPYFTTKHKSQGTGLGLYISKMIIEESMGGLLYVTPLKQGTCFHIDLKDRND
jgi:C4-dicarboxylate-specific signal transduction histidine kinase